MPYLPLVLAEASVGESTIHWSGRLPCVYAISLRFHLRESVFQSTHNSEEVFIETESHSMSVTSFQVSRDLEDVASASTFIAQQPVGYWSDDGTLAPGLSVIPEGPFGPPMYPAYDASTLGRACDIYGAQVVLVSNLDGTFTGTQIDRCGDTHCFSDMQPADIYGQLLIEDLKALDRTEPA